MAGGIDEVPLRKGSIDIYMDDYSVTNSLCTYGSFIYDKIHAFLKETEASVAVISVGKDNDNKLPTSLDNFNVNFCWYIGEYKGKNDVPDSVIDTNDGHSDSENFATRAEAIQALYEAAGSPAVNGSSRFTDVSANETYADAVKWGEDNKICFGYPMISSDTFCPDELISRQDFALMAHRYADYLGFGTAFDYGRTDWFNDFSDIDFYAWGPFTWAIQWRVISYDKDKNICCPHGRLTKAELKAGVAEIFDLDEGASYSGIVGGNEGNPDEQ